MLNTVEEIYHQLKSHNNNNNNNNNFGKLSQRTSHELAQQPHEVIELLACSMKKGNLV